MANPRQRRKARSSSHKPVSHSRNAQRNLKKTPAIRGPKALQDAWDNRKTVKQNYAALGLIHTLSASASGGVEPMAISDQPGNPQSERNAELLPSTETSSIPQGFGRIIRDESGNILRIELPFEEDPEREGDAQADGESLEHTVISRPIIEQWVTDLGGGQSTNTGENINVVGALEEVSAPINRNSRTLSARLSGIGSRISSAGERKYLGRLVEKYGVDVEQMARDRRLNPEQRTSGQLRRALKKAGMDEEV